MKFSGNVDHGKINRCLHFFGVPDYYLDVGNFKQLSNYRNNQLIGVRIRFECKSQYVAK